MLRPLQLNVGRLLRKWWELLPQPLRRLVKLGVGSFFLLLGIIGIFVPVMPQLFFFFLSLTILSSESARARSWLKKITGMVRGRRKTKEKRGWLKKTA